MGDGGVPHVLAADSKPCAENTWEARLDAVDEALATVEDAVGTTKIYESSPSAFRQNI